MAAERETMDRLIAAHMAAQIGARFTARIAGVTRAGLFVRLKDTGADGFIPAASLGVDYFRFEEASRALVGTRTGETFRLGDTVEVRLVEAAPFAGALRFEMLSKGGARAPAGQEGSSPMTTATPATADAASVGPDRRDLGLAAAARILRPLPALRRRSDLSRLSQGGRRLPGLRRGFVAAARRRRAGLYHDADRRPFRRRRDRRRRGIVAGFAGAARLDRVGAARRRVELDRAAARQGRAGRLPMGACACTASANPKRSPREPQRAERRSAAKAAGSAAPRRGDADPGRAHRRARRAC